MVLFNQIPAVTRSKYKQRIASEPRSWNIIIYRKTKKKFCLLKFSGAFALSAQRVCVDILAEAEA